MINLVKDKKWEGFIRTRDFLPVPDWRVYSYSGEVDQDDNLCGHGIAVFKDPDGTNDTFEGTFSDNERHGIGKALCINLLSNSNFFSCRVRNIHM